MERVHLALDAPGLGRAGTLIRYGYFGRPVIAFPTEGGHAWDFEDNGMVSAMRPLLEAGRIKLYCVDSFDDVTWSDRWISVEDRARKHRHFESWITGPVSQWIADDSPGADSPIVTGCGLGAYHALQLALTRADMFPIAICMSGNYDPSTWHAGRARRRRLLHESDGLRAGAPWGEPGVAPAARACRPHGGPRHLGVASDGSAGVDTADGCAAGREGHPLRTRHLGVGGHPRLAVVARADLLSSAPILLRRRVSSGWECSPFRPRAVPGAPCAA